MNKRGQVSLEFLMTYGWAIFVVIGVIAAFSFIGVIHPETYIVDRCLISQPFFCEDSSFLTSTGDVVFRLRNSFQEDIAIKEISFDEEGCWTIIMPPGGEVIEKESSKDFTIDCDFEKGQSVRGGLEIKYSSIDAPVGFEKVTRGEFIAKVL